MIVMHLSYLVGAVFFIYGIKRLGSPRTARQGNLMAMIGMLIAIVVTLAFNHIVDWTTVIAGLIVGSVIGIISAKRVQMTAMPQMVALFNGFGGGASTLVALAEYYKMPRTPMDVTITILASLLIGSVTFTGSLIAFARLQGLMKGSPTLFKGQHILNAVILIVLIVFGVMFAQHTDQIWSLWAVVALALVLGVTTTIPIGGADMPVVIALLNSYSGLAAAATGFVLRNNILIISGSLVGASGIILTLIMCRGMNRTLANVLFGGVGTEGGGDISGEKKTVAGYSAEEAAMMLDAAQSVIIVPGYGLAVAQAQHALRELAQLLVSRGCNVRYAIHPVAGRMPGHMNVLLAEANVSYDLLLEMDEINDDFKNTDVTLVIGANDVINPAARYKKGSPLYGMPILNADQSRAVMIIKRSLSPGFAGEENELFYDQKTMMLFGDAKKMVTALIDELNAT